MIKRTWAEIDLGAIKNNMAAVKKSAGSNVKILLPVKADAYGHGIAETASWVDRNNLAQMLGVASIDEGIILREAGVTMPILILGLILPDNESCDTAVRYDLRVTIADMGSAAAVDSAASRFKKTAIIHMKIDTGMGRIGCFPREASAIAAKISSLPNLRLEGIYSHFPSADDPDRAFTLRQIEIFNHCAAEIESLGIRIPLKHLSNSAGALNYPQASFDMIRPGIVSYGYDGSQSLHEVPGLIPAMTLKSAVLFIKRVDKNTPLSYGLTYKTERECNIATIAAGYGDGYNRLLSNKGRVAIGNKLYPVAGRVSMDQILVNLGDDIYPVGEEVILFGRGGITAADMAELTGTIPYEILCGVSKRVPRIYIN